MRNDSLFEHPRPGLEWADINSGDEWKYACLPYADEPPRTSGFSVTSDSTTSDGFTILNRRVRTDSTPTKGWVAAT